MSNKSLLKLLEKHSLGFIADQSAKGKVWDVVLIEAGISKNDNLYSPEVLKAAAPLFEGLPAQAYQFGNTLPAYNHLPDDPEKRKRGYAMNTIGYFSNVRYSTFTTKGGRLGEGLLAKFTIYETHNWLMSNLLEAFTAGHDKVLGFSIDAEGSGRRVMQDGRKITIVEKIHKVRTTDVVSEPAAGGQLLRLVASMGDQNMWKKLLNLITNHRPSWMLTIKESEVPENEKALRVVESAYQRAHKALMEDISFSDTENMNAAARAFKTLGEVLVLAKESKIDEAASLLETWITKSPDAGDSFKSYLFGTPVSAPAPTPVRESRNDDAVSTRLNELENQIIRERNNNRLILKLNESKLPKITQARILESNRDSLTLTEAGIDTLIRSEQDYINALAPASKDGVTGLGGAYPQSNNRAVIQLGEEKKDRLGKAFDLLFEAVEYRDGVRAFTSLKEAWAQYNPHAIHYAPEVMGRWIFEAIAKSFPANFRDASREPLDAFERHQRFIKENWNSQISGNLREAVVSSEFTTAFGDSFLKRMQAMYLNDPAANWREIVSPSYTNLTDATRPYSIVRMGDIPVLPQVNERDAYQELIDNPTEKVELITPHKYGGVYSLTWESVMVDDLGYLRLLPQLLAKSSNRRIARNVFGHLENNDTLNSDSARILSSTHANLISGNPALSYAGIVAGFLLFRNFTAQDTSEKLGLAPSILLTGPKIEATAWELTASDRKATAAEDSTLESFVKGKRIRPIMSIEVGKTTTTDDYWWLLADPREVETISVGFLGGRSTPDIFVQGEQTPTSGSVFTQDVITFKVRLVFGSTWVDWRGVAGSQN